MSAERPARILVVDDERLVARDIAEHLKALGYEVPGTVATADEAIEIASRSALDLVLIDIRIQGPRDGIEAAELLRRRFGLPVIYLTARSDPEALARAKATEPYGYLVKPVKPVDLRSAVEIALSRSTMDRSVREREARLSTTLRAINDAVLSTDAEGRVTYMNRAAEALTGWTAAEATGQPFDSVLVLIDEVTKARIESPLARALRDGQAVELPPGASLRSSSGNELAVEDSAAPIIDETGRTVGAVMVFRDVSEQRRLLRQAELNDRLAALGTLAAGVAHEVNNPLSFILGNLQYALGELEALQNVLSDEPPAEREQLQSRIEDVSAALSDAQTGADRVRRIVSELRRLSRPTLDRRDPLDLRVVIDSALSMTMREVSKRARVIREFGDCPLVIGDDTRLTQVFVNLLVNAAHAIATGHVNSNEVRVVTGTDPDGNAFAEVRDTGSGIPKNLIPRIFEPFFTTRALTTGTGLGLSISHGIITSLGGTLRVESRVGVGSTFRVTLPPVDSSLAPPAARPVVVERQRLARPSLLIVDDERILLDSLARALDENYSVDTASGAREALELLEQGRRFDLLLSDLLMPELTGMELYAELEGRFPEQAARTAFMTGGAFTPKAQQFLKGTTRRLIEKPFTNQELLKFLDACLHGSSTGLRDTPAPAGLSGDPG